MSAVPCRVGTVPLLLMASWAAAGTAAHADTPVARIDAAAVALQTGGGADRARDGDLTSIVHLEADANDAKATVALRLGGSSPNADPTIDGQSFVNTNFSASISVPVGTGGSTSIFDFNQLSDGTEINAGASFYFGRMIIHPPADPASRIQTLSRAYQQCLTNAAQSWDRNHSTSPDDLALRQRWQLAFDNKLSLTEIHGLYQVALRLVDQSLPADSDLKPVQEFMQEACHIDPASTEDAFVGTFLGLAEQRRLEGEVTRYGIWSLGGKVSAARANYSFIDVANFSLSDVSRTAYGATIYGGYQSGDGGWSAQLSLAYRRHYQALDDRTLCRPTGSGGISECFTAAGGPPVQRTSFIGSAEVRAAFRLGNTRFAIAPRIDYNFDDQQALISAPIYLLRNTAGALTGGIRLGYGTREDAVEARIFVGVPFSTLF